MEKIDWERLELNIKTEKTEKNNSDVLFFEKNDEFFRTRVIFEGKLGVVYSSDPVETLEKQIEKALLNSIQALEVGFQFLTNDSQKRDQDNQEETINELSSSALFRKFSFLEKNFCFLKYFQILKESIQIKLFARNGNQLTQQTTRLVCTGGLTPHIPFFCESSFIHEEAFLEWLRLYTVTAFQKDIMRIPWLISPVALAGFALNDWHQTLTSQDQQRFPENVNIWDPGHFYFDFEGSKHFPISFVEKGKYKTGAFDLERAWKEKSTPTGHGGYSKIRIRDFFVGSSFPLTAENKEASAFLIDARNLTGTPKNLYALTLIQLKNDLKLFQMYNILVFLPNLNNLFQGIWKGKFQKGREGWNSPWLWIDSPHLIFQKITSSD